jgi:mono/diheme cytochrome c family protein
MPATPAAERYASEIYPILEANCLACHHARVEPPWYAALPGIGPWVKRDVEWGRQRLDLSLPYPLLDADRARDLDGRAYLYALRTVLLDDSMPPLEYWLVHPTASLSAAERTAILDWVDVALAEWAAPGEEAAIPERAAHLFRSRCARCHNPGVDEDMNGAFDFVSDLEFLAEDEDYVVAEDADESPLFERLVDDEDPMPPSRNDGLSENEIEIIRRWIDEGAEAPETP